MRAGRLQEQEEDRHELVRLAVVAVGAVIASASVAWSQQLSLGQREFESSCAVCHGKTGKGDGPVAQVIVGTVPDLTALTKNNKGVFPVERMYEVIDGRAEIVAHGLRDMPVWGYEYSSEATGQMLATPGDGGDAQAFVRGRILALIEYISTLQEK